MKRSKNSYRNLTLITQLGISVIVPIFLCLFIGIWLDNRFSTWFTIPLLILGFLAGGRNAYIMAKDSIRMDERKKKKDEENK
ncbi:MAG: AtpZ/AtpI family protein [Lachnospiraceae bacterium]|nr:AtpZ/AtpI family protein [Lachnospiraceae bacterium]